MLLSAGASRSCQLSSVIPVRGVSECECVCGVWSVSVWSVMSV